MPNMYFAKVSISSKIYDVYKDESLLDKILDNLVLKVNDKIELTINDEIDRNNIGDTIKFITLDNNIEKRYISGRLIRIYTDDVEKYDASQNDILKLPTDQLARYATFYFDLKTEIIGFTLGRYFGKNQFCNYFQALLNEFTSDGEFKVFLYKNEMSFRDDIQRLKKISSIYVSMIIPNAPGDKSLRRIFGVTGENLKEMNATQYNQEFKSDNNEKGININTEVINGLIDGTCNGYGTMKIQGQDESNQEIVIYSKEHPYTRSISQNQKNTISEVSELTRKYIKHIVSNFLRREH
nr:MAG TPA: protein of unknown function (DUF4747) [Bacteriophage sp.]